MRLEGKVALVTGGARGIGEATARLFAREGARVVIGDILVDEGKRVAEDIEASGGQALFVNQDVRSDADWKTAVEATGQRFGKLDILVNNAGVFLVSPIEETSDEEYECMMETNVRGVFLGTKYAIPAMRQAGGGSIVNISSTAGMVGNPSAASYSATKGAVRLFTKGTAIQHAKDGIRANSIHPGVIDTVMLAFLTDVPERRAEMLSKVPMGRLGTAEEIAYGALLLASDESSYMTGSELVIDGGRTTY